MQVKARKDVAQAARFVLALEELRPGDVKEAVSAARARGKTWRAALDRGIELLRRVDANAGSAMG